MTSALVEPTRDIPQRDVKNGVFMIRRRAWKVAGVIFLGLGMQLLYGLQLYAKQPDLRAAIAAKVAAGREASSHGASNASDPVGTFITFDAPGAVKGTVPASMNPAGAITGYYFDASSLVHGFLRDSNGTFTTFDVPSDVSGTFPTSINPAGAITGDWGDANSGHGFLRDSNGGITSFDAPGDVFGILPTSINPEAAITGVYFDANFMAHGFLRAGDGTVTTFDDPDAGTTSNFIAGTTPVGINTEGVIRGYYTDATSVNRGFLRARDGTFTTFDPPGQISDSFDFVYPPYLPMNPEGVITGAYFEPISGNPFGGNFRVFVRARDGTFTTFDGATLYL
jgi:hypothetical protein